MSARRDPTNAEALLGLYVLQQVARFRAKPEHVLSKKAGYLAGIRSENRGVSFRLYAHGIFHGCLRCASLLRATGS